MATRKASEVTPQAAIRSRARGLFATILLQLLLGMAVNLIGMPMQTASAAKIASDIFLSLHILIAIGMVVGGILTAVYAGRVRSALAGVARMGLAVIIITFAAGVLTAITKSNWWSYLMAAGATALLLIYGVLFVRTGESTAQQAS
jgi:hypothetical protein